MNSDLNMLISQVLGLEVPVLSLLPASISVSKLDDNRIKNDFGIEDVVTLALSIFDHRVDLGLED